MNMWRSTRIGDIWRTNDMTPRRATLMERQAAFAQTFDTITEVVMPGFLALWREPASSATFPEATMIVLASIINASSALVVGADLTERGMVRPAIIVEACDDCGRTDGSHDLEVEH